MNRQDLADFMNQLYEGEGHCEALIDLFETDVSEPPVKSDYQYKKIRNSLDDMLNIIADWKDATQYVIDHYSDDPRDERYPYEH